MSNSNLHQLVDSGNFDAFKVYGLVNDGKLGTIR